MKALHEDFVKSAFAKKYGREFLLCFGVYGAVGTIKLLRCLKDGGVKTVIFIGSIGARPYREGLSYFRER